MKKLHKVLLVDDDYIVNYLNQLLFQDLDIAEEIIIVTNGSDALEFIKSQCINSGHPCPNLIIIDLNMPVMGGKDLLLQLKMIEKTDLINSKIAVLTSSNHPNDIEHVKILGVKVVEEKPLTEEKIIRILNILKEHSSSFYE